MTPARTLLFTGTASHVGKSTVAAGDDYETQWEDARAAAEAAHARLAADHDVGVIWTAAFRSAAHSSSDSDAASNRS